MPTQPVSFPGSEGHPLAARLELPPGGRPHAWAVFAHCFTCSKNVRAAVRITRGLCGLGMGVLRFDFTGLGESEGDFADTDFSSNVADLVAAAQWLEAEHGAPEILVGHSLGGAAVLHAAHRLPSVRAVATIGAPSDPAHVLHLLQDSIDEIEAKGQATVELAGRPFTIKRDFLEDLAEQRVEKAVSELDRALLIMHAPRDEVVGIDNAARLYAMAKHPKSFVSLDDADHLLSEQRDADYVARVLSAWSSRYVTMAEPSSPERLVDEDRVVTQTGSEGYRTEIAVRQHALTADEPVAVGGDDAGPTPYDLLLAGLGACTSMTLQMYARRKGWPLEEARVRLRHRKLHGRDCERCEDGDERLDQVDRVVEMDGPLDDEQRQRLMEIADRCPVHRTLDAGVRIRTEAG